LSTSSSKDALQKSLQQSSMSEHWPGTFGGYGTCRGLGNLLHALIQLRLESRAGQQTTNEAFREHTWHDSGGGTVEQVHQRTEEAARDAGQCNPGHKCIHGTDAASAHTHHKHVRALQLYGRQGGGVDPWRGRSGGEIAAHETAGRRRRPGHQHCERDTIAVSPVDRARARLLAFEHQHACACSIQRDNASAHDSLLPLALPKCRWFALLWQVRSACARAWRRACSLQLRTWQHDSVAETLHVDGLRTVVGRGSRN
jgi:hypothetical protein